MPKGARQHVPRHQQLSRRRRPTAVRRGYNYRWQRESKQFLAAHPHCVECMAAGRPVAAECVDHIIPHRGNLVLFWDQSNWQGLCIPHHNAKTRKGL